MFRNDPTPEQIPALGTGTVDIGVRVACGQAARYDGTDPQALIDFVNDPTLTMIEGALFRRTAGGDFESYVKVLIPAGATVVFRPPAGDWRFLTDSELTQQFAICERGSVGDIIDADPRFDLSGVKVTHGAVDEGEQTTPKPVAKKAPAKKAVAPK